MEHHGLARLTTTRIAERAGISVGTLYQYFPNKRTLLAELLRSHLRRIVDAVATAAEATVDAPLETRVCAVVAAFVEAKCLCARDSRTLHPVFADLNIAALALPELQRARAIAADIVRPFCACLGVDPELVALILVTGMEGPVSQRVMQAPETLRDPTLLAHLQAAALGYLRALEDQSRADLSERLQPRSNSSAR